MPTAVILDLETVPDTTLWSPPEPEPYDPKACEKGCGRFVDDWAAFNALPREQQKCSAMKRGTCRPAKAPAPNDGNEFAPIYAHRVIVAGFTVVVDGVVTGTGASWASDDEQERSLLEGLSGFMSQADQIVTWGGRRFDVPVIKQRSFRHCVAQPWIDEAVDNRYGARHLDLSDITREYGAIEKAGGMDVHARLCGMPGKNGFDGSMVAETVAAGRLAEVVEYCKRDVTQIAAIWFRWQRMRGRISQDAYVTSVKGLVSEARKHESMKDQTVFPIDWPRLEGI